MSPGAEDANTSTAAPTVTTAPLPHGSHVHHHHQILVEPAEDRWRWRAKIRRNPYQLRIYRVGVAILGLLFIALGFVSGPLPGPGGIPLVLLGLAVWASEFEWANRLMIWFKGQLRRYRRWGVRRKMLFWAAFFSVCGLCGYAYLLTLGPPGWLPQQVDSILTKLPGI